MSNKAAIAAGVAALVAALVLLKRIAPEQFDEIIEQVEETVTGLWEVPANGLKYMATITRAANENGIPAILLARVLYQESRFRDDIISGKVRSPAGAVGIAQFMPATARELGVDPLDPNSAIPGAARYLAKLYSRFGNWTDALAAYNWGQGNVASKGVANAPTETKNYFSQILADVGFK